MKDKLHDLKAEVFSHTLKGNPHYAFKCEIYRHAIPKGSRDARAKRIWFALPYWANFVFGIYGGGTHNFISKNVQRWITEKRIASWRLSKHLRRSVKAHVSACRAKGQAVPSAFLSSAETEFSGTLTFLLMQSLWMSAHRSKFTTVKETGDGTLCSSAFVRIAVDYFTKGLDFKKHVHGAEIKVLEGKVQLGNLRLRPGTLGKLLRRAVKDLPETCDYASFLEALAGTWSDRAFEKKRELVDEVLVECCEWVAEVAEVVDIRDVGHLHLPTLCSPSKVPRRIPGKMKLVMSRAVKQGRVKSMADFSTGTKVNNLRGGEERHRFHRTTSNKMIGLPAYAYWLAGRRVASQSTVDSICQDGTSVGGFKVLNLAWYSEDVQRAFWLPAQVFFTPLEVAKCVFWVPGFGD